LKSSVRRFEEHQAADGVFFRIVLPWGKGRWISGEANFKEIALSWFRPLFSLILALLAGWVVGCSARVKISSPVAASRVCRPAYNEYAGSKSVGRSALR